MTEIFHGTYLILYCGSTFSAHTGHTVFNNFQITQEILILKDVSSGQKYFSTILFISKLHILTQAHAQLLALPRRKKDTITCATYYQLFHKMDQKNDYIQMLQPTAM